MQVLMKTSCICSTTRRE